MILLRHCQSEFNLHFTRTRCDPGIVDPALTTDGLIQAQAAADALAEPRITRIIVSPYRRALQTATPIAERLGLPLTISSLIRERYAFVCDVGSPRSALEQDWPGVDFSGLDEVWWNDGSSNADGTPQRESEDSVIARAATFRAQMATMPDWQNALVVSHWGFLLALSGRSLENGRWLQIDPTEELEGPIVWRHDTKPSDQKPGDLG